MNDGAPELKARHLCGKAEDVKEGEESQGVKAVFPLGQVLHTRVLEVQVGVGYHGLVRVNHTFRQSGGT